MQITPLSTPNRKAPMTATTPTTAPLPAQTGAAVHRAVVPHRHLEMIVRHPNTHAWWNFR
jgi:hypothetical protein